MPDPRLASLSGVTHRYGSVLALDGLDLEVRPGEVLAVLGPNGAGKTTAISLPLGTLPVQSGAVRVFGAGLEEAFPALTGDGARGPAPVSPGRCASARRA